MRTAREITAHVCSRVLEILGNTASFFTCSEKEEVPQGNDNKVDEFTECSKISIPQLNSPKPQNKSALRDYELLEKISVQKQKVGCSKMDTIYEIIDIDKTTTHDETKEVDNSTNYFKRCTQRSIKIKPCEKAMVQVEIHPNYTLESIGKNKGAKKKVLKSKAVTIPKNWMNHDDDYRFFMTELFGKPDSDINANLIHKSNHIMSFHLNFINNEQFRRRLSFVRKVLDDKKGKTLPLPKSKFSDSSKNLKISKFRDNRVIKLPGVIKLIATTGNFAPLYGQRGNIYENVSYNPIFNTIFNGTLPFFKNEDKIFCKTEEIKKVFEVIQYVLMNENGIEEELNRLFNENIIERKDEKRYNVLSLGDSFDEEGDKSVDEEDADRKHNTNILMNDAQGLTLLNYDLEINPQKVTELLSEEMEDLKYEDTQISLATPHTVLNVRQDAHGNKATFEEALELVQYILMNKTRLREEVETFFRDLLTNRKVKNYLGNPTNQCTHRPIIPKFYEQNNDSQLQSGMDFDNDSQPLINYGTLLQNDATKNESLTFNDDILGNAAYSDKSVELGLFFPNRNKITCRYEANLLDEFGSSTSDSNPTNISTNNNASFYTKYKTFYINNERFKEQSSTKLNIPLNEILELTKSSFDLPKIIPLYEVKNRSEGYKVPQRAIKYTNKFDTSTDLAVSLDYDTYVKDIHNTALYKQFAGNLVSNAERDVCAENKSDNREPKYCKEYSNIDRTIWTFKPDEVQKSEVKPQFVESTLFYPDESITHSYETNDNSQKCNKICKKIDLSYDKNDFDELHGKVIISSSIEGKNMHKNLPKMDASSTYDLCTSVVKTKRVHFSNILHKFVYEDPSYTKMRYYTLSEDDTSEEEYEVIEEHGKYGYTDEEESSDSEGEKNENNYKKGIANINESNVQYSGAIPKTRVKEPYTVPSNNNITKNKIHFGENDFVSLKQFGETNQNIKYNDDKMKIKSYHENIYDCISIENNLSGESCFNKNNILKHNSPPNNPRRSFNHTENQKSELKDNSSQNSDTFTNFTEKVQSKHFPYDDYKCPPKFYIYDLSDIPEEGAEIVFESKRSDSPKFSCNETPKGHFNLENYNLTDCLDPKYVPSQKAEEVFNESNDILQLTLENPNLKRWKAFSNINDINNDRREITENDNDFSFSNNHPIFKIKDWEENKLLDVTINAPNITKDSDLHESEETYKKANAFCMAAGSIKKSEDTLDYKHENYNLDASNTPSTKICPPNLPDDGNHFSNWNLPKHQEKISLLNEQPEDSKLAINKKVAYSTIPEMTYKYRKLRREESIAEEEIPPKKEPLNANTSEKHTSGIQEENDGTL